MSLYDHVADLPLTIDAMDLERHEMDTSAGFTRVSTVVELHGDGGDGEGVDAPGGADSDGDGAPVVGRGEDVTYEAEDQETLLDAHAAGDLDWDLAGEYTLDSFSTALDDRNLFPEPPEQETFRHYRRWALESAALDLALRQADTHFAAALDRSYDPVEFVVSTRLDTGDDPSADRVEAFPERYARILEDLLVGEFGAGWPEGESGDRLRSRIRSIKESYLEGTDVTYDRQTALAYALYHLPDYYAAIGYVLVVLLIIIAIINFKVIGTNE